MEKKKFSIELPKGGMINLAKQTVCKPHQEPSADATEWQRFTHYLDEFKNVSEHGECVWLLKDVKREIERVKFESNVKLNIRQLVNAIILAFIKEYCFGCNVTPAEIFASMRVAIELPRFVVIRMTPLAPRAP